MQIIGGPFRKEDMICADLRRLQQRCGCTDATCADILKTFQKYLGFTAPKNFKQYDKKMRKEAGAELLRLNGCPHCKSHVYLPKDKAHSCPHINRDGTVCGHPRYDDSGKALERVFYFPLRSKIKALLRTPAYKKMLEHEFERPRNRDLITDVYDTPAWKDFLGAVMSPNNRMGLQFCVDGIPAFSANTLSLKPAEFVNLSLPPTERSKIENILLLMLLPNSMKGDQSKKYYDFAARYELNDLFNTGVNGVKVKVFSTTMDTPGRSELLGQ